MGQMPLAQPVAVTLQPGVRAGGSRQPQRAPGRDQASSACTPSSAPVRLHARCLWSAPPHEEKTKVLPIRASFSRRATGTPGPALGGV